MKFAVSILLLVAASQAADTSRSKQSTEDSKTEKRALVEGNAGVAKRAPVIQTSLPSKAPGIEYADSKDVDAEKSPQRQQIYATPVPQLAKISDVVTGQGPPYQAAIASHLFAPVSIYQSRLGSPAYEISAPVAAQLAYTENLSYQPKAPQQYTPQVFKQKPDYRLAYQPQYQAINQFPAPQIYPIPQNQQPQVFSVPQNQQPQVFSVPQNQQPQVFSVPQNQQPQAFSIPQNLPTQVFPIPQNQQHQIVQIPQQYQPQLFFSQYKNQIPHLQQLSYEQQPLSAPPGIVYAQEERAVLKTAQTDQPTQNSLEGKRIQNYNGPSQGAISFASFSIGPPVQNQAQYQQQRQQNDQQYQQYQTPGQNERRYQQASEAQQYKPQIQQYHTQATPSQPLRPYQIQREPVHRNIQYEHYNQQLINQAQSQVQIQPQVVQKLEPSPANSVTVQTKPVLPNSGKDIQYARGNQLVYQAQPDLYQNQDYAVQSPYGNPALVPTYPPVQFFGKFAHDIFRHYQQ